MTCIGNPVLKYQSTSFDTTADSKTIRHAYVSDFDTLTGMLVEFKPGESTYGPSGMPFSAYFLDEMHLQQDDGKFYSLETIYKERTYSAVSKDISDFTSGQPGGQNQPDRQSLSVDQMSNPLQQHPAYRMYWNNNLYSVHPPEEFTPQDIESWKNATFQNQGILTFSKSEQFAWAKNYTQLPMSNPDGTDKIWYRIIPMCFPGVQSFSTPKYSITETAKRKRKVDCSWVISRRVGKIGTPIKGSFGLYQKYPNGNFLCVSASCNYDAADDKWVAELVWEFNVEGWNTIIYGTSN